MIIKMCITLWISTATVEENGLVTITNSRIGLLRRRKLKLIMIVTINVRNVNENDLFVIIIW